MLLNSLMAAVHPCHITEQIKIGFGFNIAPMWHPLRLAEDYAQADLMTKGRTISALGAAITVAKSKPSACLCSIKT